LQKLAVTEFASDTENGHSVSVGAGGRIYTASEQSAKIMSDGADGKRLLVTDGLPADSASAMPNGDLYVTTNHDKKPNKEGSLWLVKDGNKSCVDSGIKFARG
jgi:hypothetical protein